MITMPTVNQLVRKGRGSKTRKSKAPVLLVGVNTIRRKQTIRTPLPIETITGSRWVLGSLAGRRYTDRPRSGPESVRTRRRYG